MWYEAVQDWELSIVALAPPPGSSPCLLICMAYGQLGTCLARPGLSYAGAMDIVCPCYTRYAMLAVIVDIAGESVGRVAQSMC